MTYASVQDVQDRMLRDLSSDEQNLAGKLLEDVAVLIDTYNAAASAAAKLVVSCRVVIRALGSGDDDVPMGATQGSMTALGYSQSWTIGAGGSVGELYIGKTEKKLLGCGERIGFASPYDAPPVPNSDTETGATP